MVSIRSPSQPEATDATGVQPSAPAPSSTKDGTVKDQPAASPDEDEPEHLNTDDRAKGDWRGRYPEEAWREIWLEARVVGGLLLLTSLSLLWTWRGGAYEFLSAGCTDCSRTSFNRFAYFYLGGQLGGILFGVKYLYKVVARGYWNLDRRLWRFFSPFLSGGLAVAVGALMESGVLGVATKAETGSSFFALGFIVGYFADSALAKMQEIAETVFGKPGTHRSAHKQRD